MAMPVLRTNSNFSESHVPISHPARKAPSTAKVDLSTPMLATAFDTERFTLAHAAVAPLAAATAAAPAACQAVMSAGISR